MYYDVSYSNEVGIRFTCPTGVVQTKSIVECNTRWKIEEWTLSEAVSVRRFINRIPVTKARDCNRPNTPYIVM